MKNNNEDMQPQGIMPPIRRPIDIPQTASKYRGDNWLYRFTEWSESTGYGFIIKALSSISPMLALTEWVFIIKKVL